MGISKQKMMQLGVTALRGFISTVRMGQAHLISNDEAVALLDSGEFKDVTDAEKYAALRLLTAARRASANA